MKPAICFLALTGCATSMAGLSERPPSASYRSERSLPAVEQCIASALSRFGGPSVIRGETETVLNFSSGGVTSLLVTLRSDAGTSVEARTGYGYDGIIRRGVEGCL